MKLWDWLFGYLKFISATIPGTVIFYAVFSALLWYGVWYIYAETVSYLLCYLTSFLFLYHWAFKHLIRSDGLVILRRYSLMALALWASNTGILYILIEKCKVWPFLAQVFASLVLATTTYKRTKEMFST